MVANLDFLKTTPMQTVQDPKNTILEVLAGNCFTCGNYRKNRKFKKTYKNIKNYIKSRSVPP